ncbi:IS630 family transposase [Shewanella psychromarinicola]|uniref:IS630 family transposase n=1 Tax=Shewanella psychromarinicola TaxID=2487742 RepID=A0A3N4E672_9GAMM|nr:IS630 family transposase [Shewanella psychromarinicola]RPA28175.1 IS630 family transposase [Shewanella psychromarinicola]RPA32576.1 IS630 family transposase [Shewanella psychromarinicola]
MRIRILAVSCFLECHNRAQVARQLKVSRRSVNEWVKNYLNTGIDGLKANMNSTNANKLDEHQKQVLYQYIDEFSRSEQGGRLTGLDVQSHIEQQFGIHYHINHVYKVLKNIGLSWITSRSKHPKQSLAAQEDFKKLISKTIATIPVYIPLDTVDIWFQDEARFGQQNTTTRLWAAKGSRPRAVRQQQFEYAYLFGAVCPATGATEALVTPFVNRAAMWQHLKQISEATHSDRYALVIIDGAGWHTDDIAKEFSNLSVLKLPPYSPELNPIEQVWQWLRQHCLANRCFEGYDDIVEQCCRAWNTFIQCKDRVKSLCTRDWANMGKV